MNIFSFLAFFHSSVLCSSFSPFLLQFHSLYFFVRFIFFHHTLSLFALLRRYDAFSLCNLKNICNNKTTITAATTKNQTAFTFQFIFFPFRFHFFFLLLSFYFNCNRRHKQNIVGRNVDIENSVFLH